MVSTITGTIPLRWPADIKMRGQRPAAKPESNIMNQRFVVLTIASLLSCPITSGLHAQSAAALTVDVNQPKAACQPDAVRPDDGRDQLLLRWRPVRGADPQPHLPVRLDAASSTGSWSRKGGIGEDERRFERRAHRRRSPHSAKLEVTKADAQSPAGLLNEGYWGIAVRPNTRYTGSFFAKSDSDGALPVTVALVADQSGQVLAKRSRRSRRRRLEAVHVRAAVRAMPPRPPRTTSR